MKQNGDNTCCGCGRRPVFSIHSDFCQICSRLAHRMRIRRFPPQAEAAIWAYVHANDYTCYYTKMPLEMEDIRSPWFCVFDHLIPLDPRKMVLTSALINEMKSALCEREFWYYVEQLADYKLKHKKIKKIRLAYWRRRLKESASQAKLLTKKPVWPDPKAKKCQICNRPVFSLQSKYCLRCSRFNRRMDFKKFPSQVKEAVRQYLRTKGYVCQYTGLPLDTENDRSPWYCVFNNYVPGDKSKVVITFALFNEMKSDLSIKEFWYYILQLANYKRKHTRIRKKKLVYWYRLTLRPKQRIVLK